MSYTLGGGRIQGPEKTSMQCQLCSAKLEHLTVFERELHYNKHFNDEPQASSSSKPLDEPKAPASESAPTSSKWKWKDWQAHKGQDQWWHPAQSVKPPRNFTPGLIPLLKTHLNKSHAAGNTRRATLCYDRAVLINREVWDAGWGCGYRNYMMACAALMDQPFQPMYFPLLDHPTPPSVRNLQQWIEDAWKAGFDPEGARQLKQLVGTRKWIGTSDVQVAFTSRGIPSKLVDFDMKTSARGAHILTDWVVEYFSQPHGFVDSDKVVKDLQPRTVNDVLFGAAPVTVTSRMPLILQHDGHSRTIVGFEVNKTGNVNLLMFDPSRLPNERLRQAGLDRFASMQTSSLTNAVASSSTNAATTSSANITTASSAKRSATSMLLTNPVPLKRSRAYNQGERSHGDSDDEVEIVHDSRDQNTPGRGRSFSMHDPTKADKTDMLSTPDTLKFFRVDPQKLVKKKAYQILYFPMGAPLSDAEVSAARGMNIYGEMIS